MMTSYCKRIALLFLLMGVAAAMTDDEQLIALQEQQQQQQEEQQEHAQETHASQYITKIAPKSSMRQGKQLDEDLQTIVEELKAAGVQTAEKQKLETLSYKELTGLLGLWHLSQQRNYYEAAAPIQRTASADAVQPPKTYDA